MARWFSLAEPRRRSVVSTVVVAAVVLGVLWRSREGLVRAPKPTVDGAAYLRHVAPALRAMGCATQGCHGHVGARLHLSSTLTNAADAVREFHDVSARVMAGSVTESPLWRRANGDHGHLAVLRAGSCEAGVLRAWIEGRPTTRCP